MSGEIVLRNNIAQLGNTIEELIIKERSCFGYEGCGKQDLWESYSAKAVTHCVLASIEHSRLAKFISLETLSK